MWIAAATVATLPWFSPAMEMRPSSVQYIPNVRILRTFGKAYSQRGEMQKKSDAMRYDMIFSDLLIRLLCSECAIHISIQNKVYGLPIINAIA